MKLKRGRSKELYLEPSVSRIRRGCDGSSYATAKRDGTLSQDNQSNMMRVTSLKSSLDFQKPLMPLPENHPHRPMLDEINASLRTPPLIPYNVDKVTAA